MLADDREQSRVFLWDGPSSAWRNVAHVVTFLQYAWWYRVPESSLSINPPLHRKEAIADHLDPCLRIGINLDAGIGRFEVVVSAKP